ncbi:MAG TPA: DUF2512 family protein [Candidatus Bathyarchaeia archaeon]|nr:DUF2512 family protein [Candidatus Bathyarchaeia archaeon]
MGRFLVKLVLDGIILVPFLMWFTEGTIFSILMTALGLTVIAYLIGDQMILRATNNVIATISDAVLAAVYLWAVAAMLDWNLSWRELLITVAALGVAEFVYHRYLGFRDGRQASS